MLVPEGSKGVAYEHCFLPGRYLTWCKVADSRFERAKVGAMVKELRKFDSQLHNDALQLVMQLLFAGDMRDFDKAAGP